MIGGSGLYEMEGLTRVTSVKVATPFGKTSDDFIIGTLHGKRVAFLPRHGRGHRLLPTDINYRANIFAMKKLGVQRIISVSAVGSMKEKIKPGDIVIPEQFYDQTKHRRSTFFGDGVGLYSMPLRHPAYPYTVFRCREKQYGQAHRW